MPMIHNAGRQVGEKKIPRKILFPKGWDDQGEPLKAGKVILQETLMPGQHKMVTDEQYAHLKALFGNEIVNLDDLRDMQGQFKEVAPSAPRPGYLSPEEAEALIQKRVEEELAKRSKDSDSEKSDGLPKTKTDTGAPKEGAETREALIAKIDSMDRGDLIAFIEAQGLEIEYKNYKQLGSLKSAVLSAMDEKAAKAA